MVIYNDYTTNELLANEPCIIDDKCIIYPINIKEYSELINKYSIYLQLSRERLKLSKEENLLSITILLLIQSMVESENGDIKTNINKIIGGFEGLFSMVTKKEVKCKRVENIFKFEGEGITINDNNYESVRKVIMKMNLIKEPKVFDDPLTQKWYNKALLAKQKNQPKLELEDIIITVIQDMKYSFEYVYGLNIVALYSLYSKIIQRDNYDKVMMFKTVSDKLPNVNFVDNVIERLYKEDDSDMYIDSDTLGKML